MAYINKSQSFTHSLTSWQFSNRALDTKSRIPACGFRPSIPRSSSIRWPVLWANPTLKMGWRKPQWVCLLSLVLCGLTEICQAEGGSNTSAKKHKVVSTLLNARWSQTPLDMELAEFLASEPHYAQGFWPLIDFWVDERADLERMTDQTAYEGSLAFASR